MNKTAFIHLVCLCVLSVLLIPLSSFSYERPAWSQRGELVWGGNLHEPLAFYRRENREMAGVSANGVWLEDWYKKIRSKKTIKELAELGVNILYVNFAKGAGGNDRFEDLESTKKLVEICQSHGIRVLAYIQFASKHAEEFFAAHPEARSWEQVDRFGHPRIYGDRYYRVIMCPCNPGYLNYLKSMIYKAVIEFKMDGVFLDNCYYDPCYCPCCQSRFKAFVKERYPDPLASLGISNLEGISIPAIESAETAVTDRLHQAWVQWRVSVASDAADSLRSYMKQVKPEAAFCGNTIYPRMNNWHLRGVDPYRILRIFDLPYTEGHNFPRWEEGIAINNAPAMIMGLGAGSNLIPGVWLPGTKLPERSDQIELALGESLAYGGHVLAGIWALRMKGRRFAGSPDELSEPYFTREEISQPWAGYSRFMLKNQTIYTGSKLSAPLAVYHSEASMAFDFGTAYPAFINTTQALLQGHVPFDILFSQDIDKLADYNTLLLSSQRCLSEDEIEAILNFVISGGNLIVTGQSGLYDQNRIERADYGLKKLTGVSAFDRQAEKIHYNRKRRGEVIFFSGAPELDGVEIGRPVVRRAVPGPLLKVVDIIRSTLGKALPVYLEAPPSVSLSVFSTSGGGVAVHLLNYDNRNVLQNITLSFPGGPPLKTMQCSALSPDGPEYEKVLRKEGERLLIPKMKTYTCLVWEK
ncbi:MAG: hypothetical protein JRK26_06230 [Deltaproteobacteria bacterium]|nr:hypothetical protein [Deltaproteobacteria bacterium]